MAPAGAGTKHQQPDLQTAKRCFEGRAVRKLFGKHGYYDGKVEEIWSDGLQTLANIKYSDGDCEDIPLQELRKILADEPTVKKEGGGASSHKRPASSSSSSGPAAKKAKVKREKGSGKDTDKYRHGKHKRKGGLVKVKKEKGSDEKQDLLSASGSERASSSHQRRRKPAAGGSGNQRPGAAEQEQGAAGAKARTSDAYRAGLRALIADGVLEAGEGCVRVMRGAEVVKAALLPNGDVRYKGAVYASAEDLAMHVFSASAPQSGRVASAQARTAPMDEGAGADAEADADAAAAKEVADDAAAEGKGEEGCGEDEIRIEIAGKPVEHWEELMAPVKVLEDRRGAKGDSKGSKGKKADGDPGEEDEAGEEEDGKPAVAAPPPAATGAVDETAKGWLKQTEKAVSVLEAVLKDAGAMASIKGGAAPSAASEEAAKRMANLLHLKSALRKLRKGMGEEKDKVKEGDEGGKASSSSVSSVSSAATAVSAAAAVPTEALEGGTKEPLDKGFSAEVLRLHWLPWLHAEIEQTLCGLPGGRAAEALDLQSEVIKSLCRGAKPASASAGKGSEAEAGAGESQLQIAQIADYRYQLKHMVPEAREAVLDKLHEERGALKAAMTAYNRQARILDAVQSQEEEARARRHASEKDIREDLAEAEEEEKRLLEQLEATRARLAEAKLELSALTAVNGVGVGLLQRKTQRWKDKVVDTNKIYHSVQERITVLEALDRYMDGLQLDSPLAERMQFHLAQVSAWCCEHGAAAVAEGASQSQGSKRPDDQGLTPRCRIRLAYELFSLVKRLWGGEVPVRVGNIGRLHEAFQTVYMLPERSPLHWEGLPIQFPDAQAVLAGKQQAAGVACLQRGKKGSEGAYVLTAAGLGGDGVGVAEADVEKALGFQTVIVAAAVDYEEKKRDARFLEAVVAAAKAAGEEKPAAAVTNSKADTEAAEEGNEEGEEEEDKAEEEQGAEYRPLRCLLLPPPPTEGAAAAAAATVQGVPPFLYDTLVLVHSQDYLSRIALLSASAAAAAAAAKEAEEEGGEEEEEEEEEEEGGAASAAVPASGVLDPSTQAPSPMEMDHYEAEAETQQQPSASAAASAAAAAPVARKPASRAKSKASATGSGGMVVPWWEEVVHGANASTARVAPGAFAAAVQAAGRVCKAVDLVMLADPGDGAEQQAGAAGGRDVNHRAANAACLVACAGHAAGRFGSHGHGGLLNLAATGLMHARVAWGVRKVAVVDLDPRQYGQGTDEVLKGDVCAFYASLHLRAPTGAQEVAASIGAGPKPPKDTITANRVLRTLTRYGRDGAVGAGRHAFRRHITKSVLPALEAFYPELILLSLPSDAATLKAAGLTAADVEWAAREMDAVARRSGCMGRLVSLMEAPASSEAKAKEEDGDAEQQLLLAAHLRGLARWHKQRAPAHEEEEEEEEEEKGVAAAGKGGPKEDRVRPGQGKGRKNA